LLKTPIGRLRAIALIEGISFLVLLGIAMPLKYFFDMPMAVTIVGGLHGLLFVLYVASVAEVKFAKHKSIAWGVYAFILSLIPFGTFLLDAQLRRESTA